MPTEEQVREIHRLAVVGEATEIAQAMGTWLSRQWLEVSRFREARDVLGPEQYGNWRQSHAAQQMARSTPERTQSNSEPGEAARIAPH